MVWVDNHLCKSIQIIPKVKKYAKYLAILAQKKLAWGIVVMVLVQIQGFLPGLDFIPHELQRLISFTLAVILTVVKGVEMFYEKSEQLYKSGDISFDTGYLANPTPSKPQPQTIENP